MTYRSSAGYNGEELAPLMVYPTAFDLWNREMEKLVALMAHNWDVGLVVLDENVLHIGSGRRIPFAGCWNVDLDPNVGRDMQHFVCAPATELPFKDNEFFWSITSHVLEHLSWQDCTIALQEQLRVVRNGGIVGAIVPDVRYTRGLDPTHIREWEYEEFLAAFGRVYATNSADHLVLVSHDIAEPNYSFLCVWRANK